MGLFLLVHLIFRVLQVSYWLIFTDAYLHSPNEFKFIETMLIGGIPYFIGAAVLLIFPLALSHLLVFGIRETESATKNAPESQSGWQIFLIRLAALWFILTAFQSFPVNLIYYMFNNMDFSILFPQIIFEYLPRIIVAIAVFCFAKPIRRLMVGNED